MTAADTYTTEFAAANDEYNQTVTTIRARRDSQFVGQVTPGAPEYINDTVSPVIENAVKAAGRVRQNRIIAAQDAYRAAVNS